LTLLTDYNKVYPAMEGRNNLFRDILILTIFGIAFGYIEGAAAHYLRVYLYPTGFGNTLKIDLHSFLIEIGREFSTLVVLWCVAMLTRGSFSIKFSNFVFIFAIWDIVYYVALYIFEKWPTCLLDWDVLFLIPIPWFAPVIVPITISLIGIIGCFVVRFIHAGKEKIRAGFLTSILLWSALILWLVSFLRHSPSEHFPAYYDWELFFHGIFLAIAGFVNLILVNKGGLKQK